MAMTEIKAITKKERDGEHPASHYLIVEDSESPTTWHLRIRNVDGELDHRLMGAAWAALHSGYMGNVYEGPGKEEAIRKLKRLYSREDLPLPAGKTYSVKLVKQDADTATVAGYGVIFGGNDLEGEHFTSETDFMLNLVPVKMVFYDHTLGAVKHDIGTASANPDEFGLFVTAELDKHKNYVEQVLQLIEEGILGWSSGSVGHLVRREGKTIKRWPIVEFSLTATPAEPRTIGVERLKAMAQEHPQLKALIPSSAGETAEDAQKGKGANQSNNVIGGKKMSDNDVTLSMDEYKELLKAQVKAPEEAPPVPKEAEDPYVKALSDKIEALTQMIQESPKLKDAGYVAPDSEDDHEEVKSLGDFCVAVRNKNEKRLKSVYKTALAEDAGATGGYIVPTQQAAPIYAAAEPFSVLRRAGATVIPTTSSKVDLPVLDVETAPSAGDTAYAAGVVAYWESEAATLTESEPRFRLDEITVHKLAGYSIASNEVRSDAMNSIDSLLATMFGRAIGSKENYAFFRGDGVDKPYGIVNSGALISGTRSAASTVALADLSQMVSDFLPSSWGKGAWFINPEVMDQIIQLVSSPLSFLTNMQASFENSRLLGMPMYITAALPSLNTAGDILLVDPSYYVIADRQQLSIAFSEHYKFVNDQGTWRFTSRVGGQPWLQTYITLENASTTVSPFVALAAG